MRGAQRSSLTNWDALLLRLRGGEGWQGPGNAQNLGRGSATAQLASAPREHRHRGASQLDGEARGGMLRSKSGPCHPHQHPPGLEALHTLWGENIGWLFGTPISAIRERHGDRDDGTGGREA